MSRICIALATYNGEKYLSQMLDSLVNQSRPADMIVVVDDGSSDSTLGILKSYQDKLPLQITHCEKNQGHRAAFSKALEIAKPQLNENDLVALADQDDIWLPKKLEFLEQEIGEFSLIWGDAQVVDSKGKVIADSWRNLGNLQNVLSTKALLTGFTNVTGCLSIFKARLLDVILPIPQGVPVHDQWITLCSSLQNGYKASKAKVIQYRIHSGNSIGLGHNHTWSGNLKLNLQWAKTISQSQAMGYLDNSSKEFLEKYIAYLEARLSRNLIMEYLPWAIKNSNALYPHVNGILKKLPRFAFSIVGVPFATRFLGKK